MNLLTKLKNKVQGIIKYAYVTSTRDDSLDYPNQATSFYKKTNATQIISPYGLCAHLPKNTKVVLLSVQGNSENRAAIGFSQSDRFKNLEEGEVVVGNPKSRAFVKFDKDGNIEIISEDELNITVSNDVNLKCTNCKIDATKVDLGVGGAKIARLGDQVTVGPATGTITTAGNNTSI